MITIIGNAVEFSEYPLTAATVYPSGRVYQEDIKEILADCYPHLGLYDLLKAYSGVLAGESYRLTGDRLKDAYWSAMRIGLLGQLME